MSFIEFKHIGKKYAGADKKSVDDFNLEINEKEFIAFVGPSGCGKSTPLRMVAGFEEITEGDLYIDGKRVNETAPRDRGIAMVFQMDRDRGQLSICVLTNSLFLPSCV